MFYKLSILETLGHFNPGKYLDFLHNTEWEENPEYFTFSQKFFQVFICTFFL